ncbi:MAG: DUF4126 family protein [Desulfobacterales bacterium]
MEQLNTVIQYISISMGAAWASGINLYATILVLGILQATGSVSLPPDLQVLASPLVIFAAGLMYAVEFFADKIPGVDSGWDALHTFVRIPAGAVLAYGAVSDVSQPAALAAAIVGGSLSAGSHATKSGSRAIINASPEPFTNWAASIGEDVLVVGGLWTALNYPWVFVVLLILFILLMIWILPKIWQGIKRIFGLVSRLFSTKAEKQERPLRLPVEGAADPRDIETKLTTLEGLVQKGLITEEEYDRKRRDLISGY